MPYSHLLAVVFTPPAGNLVGMSSVLSYLPMNRKTAHMHYLAFKLSHASPPDPVFLPPLLSLVAQLFPTLLSPALEPNHRAVARTNIRT